jgi:hypothetical protein
MHSFLSLVLCEYPSHLVLVIMTSLLNSFYLFEYRSLAYKLNIIDTLKAFEKQWTYFLGFGLPVSLIVFLVDEFLSFEEFACKLSFFVLFPVMVLISADPEVVGMRVVDKSREEKSELPVISKVIGLNMMVMKSVLKFKEGAVKKKVEK